MGRLIIMAYGVRLCGKRERKRNRYKRDGCMQGRWIERIIKEGNTQREVARLRRGTQVILSSTK